MNHVHFLHSGEMQNLHSIEMHFLHPGCLRAIFSLSPKGKFRIPANMHFLLSGVRAENAFRPEGDSCPHANWQYLHSGVHANIAFRLVSLYNLYDLGCSIYVLTAGHHLPSLITITESVLQSCYQYLRKSSTTTAT
jgi:hypothetical protein